MQIELQEKSLALPVSSLSSNFSVVRQTVCDVLRPGILSLVIHFRKELRVFPGRLEFFVLWWFHGMVQDKPRDVILLWVIAHLTCDELILVLFCKSVGAHGFLKFAFQKFWTDVMYSPFVFQNIINMFLFVGNDYPWLLTRRVLIGV